MDWLPTLSEWTGPTFKRIVDALAAEIANGRLVRGQQLPTHRALAKALDVDLTTVTRAYTEARRRGLLDAQVGRGTFVSESTARTARDAPFAVPIDLSMNIPPQPVEANLEQRISQGLQAIQDEFGFSAFLNYQPPGGSFVEREIAAGWVSKRLPETDPSRVVIFPGNQAIIFNTLLSLAAPGDTVLTEALTFPGVKSAAEKLKIKLIGVAMDGDGVLPDALAQACKTHIPKAVYLTPTQHNPTTATMSPQRREDVAAVIGHSKTILIEDDAYGALETGIVPVAHHIPEQTYLAVGLSKCIAPTLRVSYLVAPNLKAAEAMRSALQATTLMPPPLMVALATHWLKTGIADKIIQAIRNEARGRQDLARKHLKGLVYAAQPNAHHLWVPLPRQWRRADFHAHIMKQGLGLVGDDAFAVGESNTPGVRVSLGAARNRADLAQALQFLAATLESSSHAVQVV